MPNAKDAKLLRIHVSEGDTFDGRPIHEAILDLCRARGVAGATVFRGVEGFGESAELHRRRVLHRDQPILIVIVDDADTVAALLPELEKLPASGLVAMSDVRALRVTKKDGQ
jgi:PII-like signaling protein